MSREEAEERVSAAGFYAQVLTPDVKVVSADLRFERVRIRVDEAGVVIEGHAG